MEGTLNIIFDLLKSREIDRTLLARNGAREDDAEREEDVGAADEDQFVDDRMEQERRGGISVGLRLRYSLSFE